MYRQIMNKYEMYNFQNITIVTVYDELVIYMISRNLHNTILSNQVIEITFYFTCFLMNVLNHKTIF